MSSIIIVENQSSSHEMLHTVLEPLGHDVSFVVKNEQALERHKTTPFDIAILENSSTNPNGVHHIREFHAVAPRTTVILTDSIPNVDRAIAALKAGIFDYLKKPLRVSEFVSAINRALTAKTTVEEPKTKGSLDGLKNCLALVGNHPQIVSARNLIKEISEKGTPGPILVQGPFGIGKALVAKLIHETTRPHESNFVSLDCRITDPKKLQDLIIGESGHGGSLFKSSHGTVFLQNISDLPLDLQKVLAGLLEEISAQMQVVASCEQNLEDDLAEGRIAIELFYHISLTVIYLPPLEERREDIPQLLRAILKHSPSIEDAQREVIFDDTAVEALKKRAWSGNIEELVGVIRRAVNGVRPGDLVYEDRIMMPNRGAKAGSR